MYEKSTERKKNGGERLEDCFEGPLLGNHGTQLQTRKWRTHE